MMDSRRKFLRNALAFLVSGSALGGVLKILPKSAYAKEAPRKGKWYGFGWNLLW